MSEDKLPRTIKVWACPMCGYWRQDKSTALHQFFPDNGPGKTHDLVHVEYTLADYE